MMHFVLCKLQKLSLVVEVYFVNLKVLIKLSWTTELVQKAKTLCWNDELKLVALQGHVNNWNSAEEISGCSAYLANVVRE